MKITINKLLFLSGISIFLILLAVLVMASEYEASSVKMNATIGHLISITPSSAVQRGILFGSVQANTDDNMAENDTTSGSYENCTEYSIEADSGNSDDTDFWNKAADLNYSANIIAIENVTLEANQTADGVNVNMTATTDGSIELTNDWAAIGGSSSPCNETAAGSSCYMAYWLDVPAGIAAGTYETDYYYCGNATHGTTACS